jgi:hypothetical protein
MTDTYFNPLHQAARDQGELDGLNGICRGWGSEYKFAYMSGHAEGDKKRAVKIYAAKVENLKKAREAKNDL